jgi:hypothetical protein
MNTAVATWRIFARPGSARRKFLNNFPYLVFSILLLSCNSTEMELAKRVLNWLIFMPTIFF